MLSVLWIIMMVVMIVSVLDVDHLLLALKAEIVDGDGDGGSEGDQHPDQCLQRVLSMVLLAQEFDVTIRASQRLPPKEFSTMELMESLVITCTLSSSICILSSRV